MVKTIDLELPYALFDMRKTRAIYPSGDTSYRISGYGSYLSDWGGGRTLSRGSDSFDGDSLNIHGGETLTTAGRMDSPGYRDRTQELIRKRVSKVNDRGVPFLTTFTNTRPTSRDDLREAFEFLDFLAYGIPGNGVIVANSEIGSQVRRRYGKSLRLACSVIRHYDRPAGYPALFRGYDLVVLKPEDVMLPSGEINERLIQDIGGDAVGRSVVMVNARCQRDCPNAREHYGLISESAKSFPLHSGIDQERWAACNHTKETALGKAHVARLIDLGVVNFKLGRYPDVVERTRALFPGADPFRSPPETARTSRRALAAC